MSVYVISQSPLRYLERRRRVQTQRSPVPRIAPELCAVHSLPMAPPLPDPQLLPANVSIPDQGVTTQWPHGTAGEAGVTS